MSQIGQANGANFWKLFPEERTFMATRQSLEDLNKELTTRQSKVKEIHRILSFNFDDTSEGDWLKEIIDIYTRTTLMLDEFHLVYCDYDNTFTNGINGEKQFSVAENKTIKSIKELPEHFSKDGSLDSTFLSWKGFMRIDQIILICRSQSYVYDHLPSWRTVIVLKAQKLKSAIDDAKNTIARRPPNLDEFTRQTQEIKSLADKYKTAVKQNNGQVKKELLLAIGKLLTDKLPKQWSDDLKRYQTNCISALGNAKNNIEQFQKWIQALVTFELYNYYSQLESNSQLLRRQIENIRHIQNTPNMEIIKTKLETFIEYAYHVLDGIQRILWVNVPLQPIDDVIKLLEKDEQTNQFIQLLNEYKAFYPSVNVKWIVEIRFDFANLLNGLAKKIEKLKPAQMQAMKSIDEASKALNYEQGKDLFLNSPFIYSKELPMSINIRMTLFEIKELYARKTVNQNDLEKLKIKLQRNINKIKEIRAGHTEAITGTIEFYKTLDESAFDKFVGLPMNLAREIAPEKVRTFFPF